MKRNRNNSLLDRALLRRSLRESFIKLAPRKMVRNPIMFTVEAVTFVMLALLIYIAVTGDASQGSLRYNFIVFVVLLATLLFTNFAEAIAEARGRAQADSLRKTREETPAKRIEPDGQSHIVSSSDLRQGDLFECVAGDTIAADGENVEGLASIDESAVTGESAPVIREAGGDKSSVTGGTKVLSDRILVKVTARPGESFLDKMIALVEGSSRQKTPNEIALTILLAGFTIVFVIVCATLKPFADYVGANITIAAFISLFVCLIPTTIGGLLSAIGIAGMDRALRANVITKSGKAVETAGDIDTLLLDKTGTITIGNRKATAFHPAQGYGVKEFTRLCVLSSVSDQTPEGKSVVELGAEMGMKVDPLQLIGVQMVQFTAETKCSGVDMPDGRRIRKGASEAILRIAAQAGNKCPAGIEETVRRISENGGTPLIVSENEQIRGVIELQDIIKTGIRERFECLRKMGVKTVMVTGDNPLTAKYIAEKAGVDDFIAEARPEDKLEYIRREQRSGKLVAMMGDGTNDAPALAQADVGVAMNSGTQARSHALGRGHGGGHGRRCGHGHCRGNGRCLIFGSRSNPGSGRGRRGGCGGDRGNPGGRSGIVRVVHRSEPRIAVDLRIGFDRQMREPTVRSRAVPVRRVGSDLDHVARQQLAGRLALGLIISPAAHGDENLAARMAMPVVAASGFERDVRNRAVERPVPRQPGQISLTDKIFRECFGQFIPDGEHADFLRFFHIPSIYPVTRSGRKQCGRNYKKKLLHRFAFSSYPQLPISPSRISSSPATSRSQDRGVTENSSAGCRALRSDPCLPARGENRRRRYFRPCAPDAPTSGSRPRRAGSASAGRPERPISGISRPATPASRCRTDCCAPRRTAPTIRSARPQRPSPRPLRSAGRRDASRPD